MVKQQIMIKGRRIDGRLVDQVRELNMKIDYLPNVHGSALFCRGNTNVISILTYGKNSDRVSSDSALSREIYQKNFIHHYNFPNFAVNELSRFKNVSRREVGHGRLVEKTFFNLIPSFEEFPYMTRLVSEVVSSEGSSSQASICASSLVMMSAGFPLKQHIAGVALGLFDNIVLSDINDIEDKLGDIDFKIAGTKDKIYSLQMDVKNNGISLELLLVCLKKARVARTFIIEKMDLIISEPKKELPEKMFKCKKFYFGSDKLGLIIGQGGRNINSIILKTNSKIDVQNDGFILIYNLDERKITEAFEMIKSTLAQRTKF